MPIITRDDLLSRREKVLKFMTFSQLNESVGESKTRKSKTGEVTIFLSHKHEESKELQATIILLRSLGVSVYVDWLDHEMPKTTSGITAARIKEKIIECRKFVLLATEAAIASKWCNWELGFGDAKKYIDHIALFPVKSQWANYTGSEYLEIYPSIQRRYSSSFENDFDVVYPNGNKVDLKKWLLS